MNLIVKPLEFVQERVVRLKGTRPAPNDGTETETTSFCAGISADNGQRLSLLCGSGAGADKSVSPERQSGIWEKGGGAMKACLAAISA